MNCGNKNIINPKRKLFPNISNKPIIDWTGIYNKEGVIAIEPFKSDGSRVMLWKFRCFCGKEFYARPSNFFGKHADSKSCGCSQNIKAKGKENPLWEGIGDISGDYFNSIKHGAFRKSRILEFSISKEYIWNLFIQQNKKCALTGLDIKIDSSSKLNSTASLDRIDSSKGYIENNIQWVHKVINKMKWDLNQDDFINYCKLVASNN